MSGEHAFKSRGAILVAAALATALLVPALGAIYLGWFYAVLFLVGYLGGFALWIVARSQASLADIILPYLLTLFAFGLHKKEENHTRFFEAVSDQITGRPLPEDTIGLYVSLLIIPLGLWLIAPFLMKRGLEFGRFLAWTFFASMGFTELAHFVMPILAGTAYGYFPGMGTAALLVPLGFWGMWRLIRPARGSA